MGWKRIARRIWFERNDARRWSAAWKRCAKGWKRAADDCDTLTEDNAILLRVAKAAEVLAMGEHWRILPVELYNALDEARKAGLL